MRILGRKNKKQYLKKLRHINMFKLNMFTIFVAVMVTALLVLSFIFIKNNIMPAGQSDIIYDHTVIIDPGHGGEDGGAIGYNGVVEKGINLSISLKLRSFFEQAGYRVIMTRTDDKAIYDNGCNTLRQKKVSDIHNRSKIVEQNPRAVFISIHQNKFEQSIYSGTQIFYSQNNENSKLLADFLQSDIKKILQPENERKTKPAGKNLYILYHAKSPAVLVECGFLSNPQEAQKLQDNKYQNKMAFSVFYSILHFYSQYTNLSSSISNSCISASNEDASNEANPNENESDSIE